MCSFVHPKTCRYRNLYLPRSLYLPQQTGQRPHTNNDDPGLKQLAVGAAQVGRLRPFFGIFNACEESADTYSHQLSGYEPENKHNFPRNTLTMVNVERH